MEFEMTYPTKMHLVSGGRPLCTRGFGPVHGLPRKAFFELEPQHRCAKCDAKAAKLGLAPIVPPAAKPGSEEHLDALSKFFGI
jgi:hypothetical protein